MPERSIALETLNIYGHVLIVLAYLGLAVWALSLELDTRRETLLARTGGFLFFTGCALHHVEMLVHLQSGAPLEPVFHHTFATLLQVIGAPTFLIAAGPYARDFFQRR